MNAHIRLVSSDIEDEHAKRLDEAADDREQNRIDPEAVATIGLPGEGRHDQILGEAPPLLIAEPDDRAAGPIDGQNRRSRLSKLIGWRRKAKAVRPAGEPDGPSRDPVAEKAGPIETTAPAVEPATAPALDDAGEALPQAVAPSSPKRSLIGRKGPLAAALLAGVALAALVVMTWPHKAPAPVVEPGMLAEGQGKLMAPSAALATVPPREEPNVAGERPQVHETRRDEYREMLSFKGEAGGDKVTETAPGAATDAKLPAPGSAARADAATPTAIVSVAPAAAVQQDHPQSAAGTVASPEAPKPLESNAGVPPKATDVIKPAVSPAPQAPSPPQGASPSAASALAVDPEARTPAAASPAPQLPLPPALQAPPSSASPAALAFAQEPGLTEAARIEARIANLETAMKNRSSDARTRIEAEKAETQTFEQIANLAAIVRRLTGQVKDLQDEIHTFSTGADQKFADLTRRVALGEANRAVDSADGADHAPAPQSGSTTASHEGQGTSGQAKAAADVKHAYRIQAASPGLAMLAATDGSPDDRPVEVVIGTDLPGYGKVRSIEQHGEAWVVKADRGSIQ